ncbi:FumA C-terminus/TtdB family hydratase beta subunit [Klebsiella pneumoniae]|uniref:FumA C-terminus/TtdB family hydratase beta subunit n=1 Tax=Klebsiella pneumoniae TaxID=573 RepID=UPI003CFCC0B6
MSTKPFVYQDPFPLAHDDTEYYLLSKEHVSVAEFDGQQVLKVEPQALTLLAQQAFHDAAFMLRVSHQQQVASILLDPEASDNDKYVALQFLRNSEIAAKGVLPTCQDTGTAIIMGKKGQRVWTGGGDEAALAQGVYNTYTEDNLRYSQNAPLDMYKEVNTGTNLPAQIDLYSVDGEEYNYAGPAKTPAGYASGSLGPTTAGRMDSYVDLLQSHGASMVMLAKGNRSQQVTDACHKHGGFYLGSIGGPAAVLAQQSIKSLECVAYPELGMEAIWKIEVEDFPAFILVDDKGNDFFQQIQNKQCAGCKQHG